MDDLDSSITDFSHVLVCAGRHPIRRNKEMFLARARIVRLDGDVEEVLAVHSRVHGKFGGEGRALTGFECRRTDDSAGRSASFHDTDGRRGIER